MSKPYDKNKIGKFIGWGGEHFVYEYGKDKVIKFSMHVWLSGRSAVAKKKKDYEIGNRYFNKYLIPIDIKTWKKGKRAVEIQEKVKCRFLEKKDLSNPLTKKQFDDIIERYQRMKQETGMMFDLFGREGLLTWKGKKEISNILITPDNRLVLIDFALMNLKPRFYEWPLWLFIQWAKRRQKRLLKKFIN